jgi:hypothetical protein
MRILVIGKCSTGASGGNLGGAEGDRPPPPPSRKIDEISPKNKSFSSYLNDLKLSKFSDIWTTDKTYNKFLAHELKMRFQLLNFAIFNAAISTQTINIYQKIHEMKGFVKMRAVTAQNCFKIVYYFFLCTLYIYC